MDHKRDAKQVWPKRDKLNLDIFWLKSRNAREGAAGLSRNGYEVTAGLSNRKAAVGRFPTPCRLKAISSSI